MSRRAGPTMYHARYQESTPFSAGDSSPFAGLLTGVGTRIWAQSLGCQCEEASSTGKRLTVSCPLNDRWGPCGPHQADYGVKPKL